LANFPFIPAIKVLISVIRFPMRAFSWSKSTNDPSGIYNSIPLTTAVADCCGFFTRFPYSMVSILDNDFSKVS
jgi:hypothetical protein